jgi:ketosteroid isomerase-like protein
VASEVGQATLDLAPSGGQRTTVSVKYVVVWQRAGNQWRLHRDIWNSLPA